MSRYTALVLDDEEKGRNTLCMFLSEYCPDINVIGVASSGEEAYEKIVKLRPQILFFDIEIAQPNSIYKNTFQLLEKLPRYDFEVVFVTAYENYAIRAIKSHAVGYILKPVSIEELITCTASVIERLNSTVTNQRLEDLVGQLQMTKPEANRIWIHSTKDLVPVNYADIIRFEAQGKYTDVFCEDGRKLTSSKNLGEFLEILDPNAFIKVHRSHIVNFQKIIKYAKQDGGALIMNDGKELPVSKSGRERLFELLQ